MKILYTDDQVLEEARAILHPPISTHSVARSKGIPQSTVWYHLRKRLPYLDKELYQEVAQVLLNNWKRGGR